MKFTLIPIGMALLAGAAFCESHFHLTVKNVQIVAGYNNGPVKGLYVFCADQAGTEFTYKYQFEEIGNSLEYGKVLLSLVLSAKSAGGEITMISKDAKATPTVPGIISSIQY